MRKTFLILLQVVCSFVSNGQQTESPKTVPVNYLQFETGIMVEMGKLNGKEAVNYTYNTTLLRYGLFDRFEIRLLQEYLGTKERLSDTEVLTHNGMGPLILGAQVFLVEKKGLAPQIGFIGNITFNTGARYFQPSAAAPDFLFLFQHTMSDKVGLSYNIGAKWEGTSKTPIGVYTVALEIEVNEKFGYFIESYGFLNDGTKNEHSIDGGIIYQIADNIELELSMGLGLRNTFPDAFIVSGLTWQLPGF